MGFPRQCKGVCETIATKYSPFINMFEGNYYCCECEKYLSKSFPNRCFCSRARRTAKRHTVPVYNSNRWYGNNNRNGKKIKTIRQDILEMMNKSGV